MAEEGDRTFGPWMRKIREEKGISASKLSRQLEMAWSHLNSIEKGTYGPPRDYDRLRKIAEILEIPVVEVYRRAGVPVDEILGLLIDYVVKKLLELAANPLGASQPLEPLNFVPTKIHAVAQKLPEGDVRFLYFKNPADMASWEEIFRGVKDKTYVVKGEGYIAYCESDTAAEAVRRQLQKSPD